MKDKKFQVEVNGQLITSFNEYHGKLSQGMQVTIKKTPEHSQSTKVDTHEKVETGKESCTKFEEQKKL